jgi:hypothetical protein
MTYGEMFLFVWASLMTFLFFIKQRDMEVFKDFTVYKLKEVASGKATVIDHGDRVEIISKEMV